MEDGKGGFEEIRTVIGEMPVMVGSRFCLLDPLTQEERIKKGEDLAQIGGYFIINGIEKIVRLLILMRRHYPIAIERPSFQKRSPDFTSLAVTIRCVREDLFSQSITLHYMQDGNAVLRFIMRRGELMIPVIILIKCLKEVSDADLYSMM
jgi:DNA-directed RNA polymerase I subunit RPA2